MTASPVAHVDWRPNDQPAPTDVEVTTWEPGERRWNTTVVTVATDTDAAHLLEIAASFGRVGKALRRVKVSPGPVGRWMYALRSHEPTGTADAHFLGLCLECDARALTGMTLDQVETRYHRGVLGQDEWEGFTWAWATSTTRYGNYADWQSPPTVHGAREFGDRVRELVELRRVEAGSGG